VNDIYLEIQFKINDGSITDASKEQLEKYATALCKSGANTNFGSNFLAICGTVQMLLKSKISEESNTKRHEEIRLKLEELKKPHRPSFWLLVVSVTLAFVAACAAILALPQAQQVFFRSKLSPREKEQSQPIELKSQPLKPDKQKK
jgi:hypothetical protein